MLNGRSFHTNLRAFCLPLVLASLCTVLWGQVPIAPVEGLRNNSPRVHALVHARVVVSPGRVIEDGTVLVRDGMIAGVSSGTQPPADARVWDLRGKTIYPGLVECLSSLGLPAAWQPVPDRPPKKPADAASVKSSAPTTGAAHWNPLITPERDAARALTLDVEAVEKIRNLGFATAWVAPARGIFRGSSAMINLSGEAPGKMLLKENIAQHVAFEISAEDSGVCPDSLMGCVALIRQTWLDARWISDIRERTPAGRERPEASAALDALQEAAAGRQTVVLETGDELDLLRMEKIAAEFSLRAILLGNGSEYRMLSALRKNRTPLILPLNFPEVPAIETPDQALDFSLAALSHWVEAPANPARIAEAGLAFALTTRGMSNPEKDFWPRVRQAVERGLPESTALAALTTVPAELTGLRNRLGTLEPGKIANLVVASGNLFTDAEACVVAVWVDGRPFETGAARQIDLRGTWQLTWGTGGGGSVEIQIGGKPESPECKIKGEKTTISTDGDQLTWIIPSVALGQKSGGSARLAGSMQGDDAEGSGQLADGTPFFWSARRTAAFTPTPEEKKPQPERPVIPTVYPAGEFGLATPPDLPDAVLIRNATIWTCGPQGRITGVDLLVRKGRISQIGPSLSAPSGAVVIDATGCHLTPGIIDAHSHTAMSRGVNESTSAVTCEVRAADVIDATDIAIYRQLAGGVTAANLLHGSANPMGGQSAVIKLRWGSLPDDYLCRDARPGVKFALGENVKQSNWGDQFTTRYPQTRMGVVEIMRDTFLAARDYEKQLTAARAGGPPVRRNLRLEAVLEIATNRRSVHIHSYRQDEILAFLRLARELGLEGVTFQHILEGYKVAGEMAAASVGGSSFADWWGYKFEVYDAIPENGAIIHRAGVLTSFNSDSNELARRLNVDAAKAVKYGGVSEEDALKFITIHPARQLGMDRKTGSLELGKDADFVLWNGSPLSTRSKVLQSWIEGRKYFDQATDTALRRSAEVLREQIIQFALAERLEAVAGGKEGGKDAGEETPAPTLRETVLQQRRLHRWNEYQSIYHSGHDLHNCTNPAHQWR